MQTLGEFIRRRRVHTLNLSLREFCLRNNRDAGNWSKVERNMREAPDAETLANMLQIEKDSSEWITLNDLVTSQKIEKHLTDDEVKKRLPIALRASHQLSEEELKRLMDELREA